jgi:hypothetical protein
LDLLLDKKEKEEKEEEEGRGFDKKKTLFVDEFCELHQMPLI